MNDIVGIHHVGAVSADLDPTQSFYVDVLGLQHTRVESEPGPAHLSLRLGRQGSPALNFTISASSRPRRHSKLISGLILGVDRGTLPLWDAHLREHGVRVTGRAWTFGEEVLCFTDPDGLELALAEDPQDLGQLLAPGEPQSNRLRVTRLRSIELQIQSLDQTLPDLLLLLGFRVTSQSGPAIRFETGAGMSRTCIDLIYHPRTTPVDPAPGTLDKLALKVPSEPTIERIRKAVLADGYDIAEARQKDCQLVIFLKAECALDILLCLDEAEPIEAA